MIITDKIILVKIEGALDEIRPYLEADEGDIRLIEVTGDMVVKVKLMGACSDCNVKKTTLNNGVEIAVKRAVPEVKKVIDVSNL